MMNKMMKKMVIAIAAATMTLTATSAITFAAEPIKAATQAMNFTVSPENGIFYVTNDEGLNVRALPTKDSARLGGVYRGDQVTVTGRVFENGAEDGWMQISFNGQKGYVRNCLSTTKPAPIPVTPTNTGVNAKYPWIRETNSSNTSREKAQRGEMSHDNDTFTASVQYGYLALRNAPVTDPSNEIAQIQNGAMVHVQQYGSQFDYVYVPSLDMYGYVNNDYLAG